MYNLCFHLKSFPCWAYSSRNAERSSVGSGCEHFQRENLRSSASTFTTLACGSRDWSSSAQDRGAWSCPESENIDLTVLKAPARGLLEMSMTVLPSRALPHDCKHEALISSLAQRIWGHHACDQAQLHMEKNVWIEIQSPLQRLCGLKGGRRGQQCRCWPDRSRLLWPSPGHSNIGVHSATGAIKS